MPTEAEKHAILALSILGIRHFAPRALLNLYLDVEMILSQYDVNPRKLLDALDYLEKAAHE